ncbi:MAG: M15 family metallopeptidase [Actinomycetia bacterium]|nr:M15 family metallopeptidase [Actinomycetes bacterium]
MPAPASPTPAGATAAATDPIDDRYAALGGATGPLGAYVSSTTVPGGRYKQYAGGRIYASDAGAWEVMAPLYEHYLATGASTGPLGFPAAAPTPAAGGTAQRFTTGWVVATGQGTYHVAGAIAVRYSTLSGPDGKMGPPTGPERPVPGGAAQPYVNGWISWSAATGAWETFGGIGQLFHAYGGTGSHLGFPVSGETAVAGGSMQRFQNGSIWWSPQTGPVDTWGQIDTEFRQVSSVSSPLGFPTGREQAYHGGVIQSFQGGEVTWYPGAGAHAIWGAVRNLWLGYGGAGGILGFPFSTEVGEGGGSYQRFASGTVWWTPQHGAVLTWAAVDERYRAVGAFRSRLGWPTSFEYRYASSVVQDFGGGHVVWTGGAGAWEVSGPLMSDWGTHGWLVGWYGYPTGPEHPYHGGVKQDFSGGSLLSGVAPVLDLEVRPVTAADLWATWRPGCPVGPELLRLVRMNYWSFDGTVRRGEMVVRYDIVDKVGRAFDAALQARFPIRQMWREDYWGGDNVQVMAADNTSAFNCRQVVGNASKLSPHAYGTAIDINTWENPYYADRWYPSREYANRTVRRPGMLFADSALVVAMRREGFRWGAAFMDYHHFQL